MKIVALHSAEAGARVTIEFIDDDVVPTEALAGLFADVIFQVLTDNPWRNMPPIEIAYAWSVASIVAKAAAKTGKPGTFLSVMTETLEGYYTPQPNTERLNDLNG
jgi:hypothetical protein